ncbi:MAG: radical SAM protein [Myxococcota bacterium]
MTTKNHTLDFQDHRRTLDDNRYIYAVVSRRSKGLSIGVNLNPDKVCNFDCPYCQVDRTLPGGARDVDLDRLEAELDRLLALVAAGTLWQIPPFNTAKPEFRRVNDIAFAGDGEPTACTVFAGAVERIGRVRDRYTLSDVRLHLLTNATLFHRPRVQAGLKRLDDLGGEIWAKLDAGTDAYFQQVDGTRLPLQRILDNLLFAAKRRPIVLQCMFMTLDGQGPSDEEIDAWAGRIAHLLRDGAMIRMIQVYSVARAPADVRVDALDVERLEHIATAARAVITRHNADTVVQVYPGVKQGD